MKKMLLIGVMLFLGFSGFGQDLLLKRNGERIYAVVMDISKKKVTYQLWGYPYSPMMTVKTKGLWGIRFENGKLVRFDHLWEDDDDDDDDREEHGKKHKKNHRQYYDGYYYYQDRKDDDDDREEMIEEFLEEMMEHGNPVEAMKEATEEAMEEWEERMEKRWERDDD